MLDKTIAWFAAMYMAPRILAVLAGLALMPIVLSSVSVADYGVYALYLSASTFLVVFTFPRISFESKVQLADGFDEAFWGNLSTRFIVSAPGLVVPPLLLFAGSAAGIPVDFALGVAVFYGTVLPTILFQAIYNFYLAKEEFLAASGIELLRAAIVGGAAAVVVYFTRDIMWFAVSRAIFDTAALTILILTVSHKRALRKRYRERGSDNAVRNYGLKMFPSTVAAEMKVQFTTWTVAAFLGPDALAMFHVAFSSLFQKINNQAMSLVNLLYARVVRRRHAASAVEERTELLIALAAGAALAIGAAPLGYVYVIRFLPESYGAVATCFLLLCVSAPISLVAKVISLKLVVNLEARKLTLVDVSLLIVQLILSTVLTYHGQLLGACLSIVAGSLAHVALASYITSSRKSA